MINEDTERLRKTTIAFLKDYADKGYENAVECIDWLEKQGEQKPAELPKGEDYGIDGLYATIDILQKTLGSVDGYQSDDGILEHKCAITAVKKLYEKKPTEWSEEDERLFQIVIDILDRANHLGNLSHADLIACVRKLKSLRPQKQ